MLVLTRRPGEEIVIAGNIRIAVVGLKGDRVRLGITALETVPVDRAEVHERRAALVADCPPAHVVVAPPAAGR